MYKIFKKELKKKKYWLNKCPIEFKPIYYRRCVGDIFVLFESPESAHWFPEYMFSKHQNINFTVQQENIGSLSFLEVRIYRKNGKFTTFSEVFTNYESFIPTYQKIKLYTHYFIQALAYVVISRHFILKSIFWRLSSWRTVILRTALIRILNHLLIICIHIKFLFRMYLKEMFLLSCRS